MFVKKQRTLHHGSLISRFVFLLLPALFCLPIYAQQPKPNESIVSRASADKSAIKVQFEFYGNHILVPVRVNNFHRNRIRGLE